MQQKQIRHRYFKIFIPSMIVYVIGVFGISFAENYQWLSGIGLYIFAVIPVGAILTWFWAQWRFINELDEYLKMIQMKAVMFALAVILSIAASWGLLEMLANAPKLEIFWLVPVGFIAFGLAQAVIQKLENGAPNEE
ncbi:MAG: hypothetical protein HRU29_00920 [Rhizobiales bacterium]|nr:hypothetical protein [Hyphomicrobiales bacterium]NRB12934.1 hypothetical protein [Hyphomicrobiales bacterium]